MKKNKFLQISLIVPLLLIFHEGQAQESINASGGNGSGSGGTFSSSIGQVAYTTATGSSGQVEQGVQHAFEIYLLKTNNLVTAISTALFPNPTTGSLTLQIKDYNDEELQYSLIDLNGKLITNGKINSSQTNMEVNSLPSATYYFSIIQNNKNVKTYKLIKN